jgi:hypothetical protein
LKYILLLTVFLLSCVGNSDVLSVNIKNIPETVMSGEVLNVEYNSEYEYESVEAYLKTYSQDIPIEVYGKQNFGSQYTIRRFANERLAVNNQYYLEFVFTSDNAIHIQRQAVNIGPSIIINSLCAAESCETLSGNVVESIPNRLEISFYGILTTTVQYTITTPYNSFAYEHNFDSPVAADWIDNILLDKIPEDVQSYIALFDIKVYDDNNNIAQTQLSFKVIRPIEVKYYG